MVFTVKPTRRNMRWIQKNIDDMARKEENVALDRWITEGGFVADETTTKLERQGFVCRTRRLMHSRYPYRNLFR